MAGRARVLGTVAVVVCASASVAAGMARRANVQEELPRAVVARLGEPGWEVARVQVLSWEQDEMHARVEARLKVVGPRGASWVDVSGWSAVGLPWVVEVERVRPAFAPTLRRGNSTTGAPEPASLNRPSCDARL